MFIVYITNQDKLKKKKQWKINEIGIQLKKLEVYRQGKKNRQKISKRKEEINELGNWKTAELINEFSFPLGDLF